MRNDFLQTSPTLSDAGMIIW